MWSSILIGLVIVALVVGVALVVMAFWPWQFEASLKAITRAPNISLAGGVDVAGISLSAAAILGGPGVIAVHFRKRERYRRAIARVSIETLLDWIDQLITEEREPTKQTWIARLTKRMRDAVVARTDLEELPRLGLRLLVTLRDPSLRGAISCGFSDPALTGKTAAWLFPIAGVLSPLGTLDVSFDWSGRDRLDVDCEASCRIVPARAGFEVLRFAWRHVHLRRKTRAPSSTIPLSSTT